MTSAVCPQPRHEAANPRAAVAGSFPLSATPIRTASECPMLRAASLADAKLAAGAR
jgi:hypothetical protein